MMMTKKCEIKSITLKSFCKTFIMLDFSNASFQYQFCDGHWFMMDINIVQSLEMLLHWFY